MKSEKRRAKIIFLIFIQDISLQISKERHFEGDTVTIKDNFYRWLDKVESSNVEFALARVDDESRQRHKSTGGELKAKPRTERPYEIIEIDAHDLDFFWCRETYDPKGRKCYQAVGKPVMYAAIDVATSAIVGYNISFDFKPNHGTVLKLIESIIKPMEYQNDIEKAVLPSAAFREASWAMPEIIKLDNATYQLAQPIIDCVYRYGIILQYGPVRTPTYRGKVERTFGTFETSSGHMMPSTTGSNPKDIKRQDPEREAERYGITREVVEDYIRLAVTQYNNMKLAGQDGLSPYQALGKAFHKGIFPNYLRADLRTADFCVRKCVIRKIKANNKNGKRPHIYWLGAEYTSPDIANDYGYKDKSVLCEIDTDDVSYMRIYSLEGNPIGTLYAKGRYEGIKMSEKTRKEFMKAIKDGNVSNNSFSTITDKFVEELEKNSKKSMKRLSGAIKAESKGKLPQEESSSEDDITDIEFETETTEEILMKIEADRKKAKLEKEKKEQEKYKDIGTGNVAARALFVNAFGEDYFDIEND